MEKILDGSEARDENQLDIYKGRGGGLQYWCVELLVKQGSDVVLHLSRFQLCHQSRDDRSTRIAITLCGSTSICTFSAVPTNTF